MNNSRTNPFQVNATGGLVNPNTEITISGISVMATNATWALKITDGAGNIIYEADNVAGMPPNPVMPFKTTGCEVVTVTACRALIYVTP